MHDCGTSRSIGYFLEPLTCLAVFAKKVSRSCLAYINFVLRDEGLDVFNDALKCSLVMQERGVIVPVQPLSITLHGITNDSVDPSVDIWRNVSFPLIRRVAGLDDADGLQLKV